MGEPPALVGRVLVRALAAPLAVIFLADERGGVVVMPAVFARADELTEVPFDVPVTSLNDAPYTFLAAIDVLDAIDEADESNNVIWRRVDGCGGIGDVD